VSEAFRPHDVFHQWEILSELGSGLHGTVYLVRHRFHGGLFALKVMHLDDARNASKVRRSLATAKANYRIRCANVVTIHDLGCEEDGRVWVLMELLQGHSAQGLLARQRGRFSAKLALHVAIEVAWGVDAAHELGIIHRDLKPENVWITPECAVKVLDFSLAKVVPEGIVTSRKSGMGTVAYMPPEGLKSDAEVDARADVYSLGIMLWQMMAGRHPFQEALRATTELIRCQLYVEPPSISAVAKLPAYVDEFFRRALAKDPNQRFQTIAEMARAMMGLSERLFADAERGLFLLDVPDGEPPVPDANSAHGRAYEPPQAPPEHATPREAPAARVVVAGMPAVVKPAVGVVSTLPLEERGAVLPRAAPAVIAALEAAPSPLAPMRETPPAVVRPQPPARRSLAPIVVTVLVLAAAAAGSFAAWRAGRTRRPHVTAAASATAPAAVASTEPPPAPHPAANDAAPSISSAAPDAAPPKPTEATRSRRAPARPAAPATPTAPAPTARHRMFDVE
jgi:serine/threonine-protein kinase